MFKLPDSMNDWIRAGIVLIIVGAVVYLQTSGQDIPTELLTAFTGITSYYFGLLSNSRKPSKEHDDKWEQED